MNRRILVHFAIFWIGGLFGPALFLAKRVTGDLISDNILGDLIFLLWPAQMLGVVESSYGQLSAVFFAIGGNLILFSLLAELTWFAVCKKWLLWALVAGVASLLLWFSAWGSGFDYRYFNLVEVIASILIYAALILISARHARNI